MLLELPIIATASNTSPPRRSRKKRPCPSFASRGTHNRRSSNPMKIGWKRLDRPGDGRRLASGPAGHPEPSPSHAGDRNGATRERVNSLAIRRAPHRNRGIDIDSISPSSALRAPSPRRGEGTTVRCPTLHTRCVMLLPLLYLKTVKGECPSGMLAGMELPPTDIPSRCGGSSRAARPGSIRPRCRSPWIWASHTEAGARGDDAASRAGFPARFRLHGKPLVKILRSARSKTWWTRRPH